MLSDCKGILRAVTEVGMLAQWPSVVVVQCRADYQCYCFGVTVSMSEINIVNNGNRVVVEKKNEEYINCPLFARILMMNVMH